MKLETRLMAISLITNAIRDNVDVFVEEKGRFGSKTMRRVKFDSFKSISELLTNERRVRVITMLSRMLGIEIWTTDYTLVAKSIKTDDMPIALNLNTDEICAVLIAKLEKDN